MKICTVPGCDRPHKAKGLCSTHHQRLRKTGSLELVGKKSIARWGNTPCSITGCKNTVKAKGLCNMHYLRAFKPRSDWAAKAVNQPAPLIQPRGAGSYCFIRGKTIYTPDGRRTAEHRYFAEQSLGRRLSSDEIVHHINGDKFDNRLENLVVLTRSQHSTLHKYIGDPQRTLTKDELVEIKHKLDLLITALDYPEML